MNEKVKAESAKEEQLTPGQRVRAEIEQMGAQFAKALPAHISRERFERVVLTAIMSDPDILWADRKSLLEAAMRAAQDGLLPDKREGAFVVFATKVKTDQGEQTINAVQWMPMIGGIIKKIHQSGEISVITAKVVYGGDQYRTWVDDDGEHVMYEPAENPDYNMVRAVFAMAKTREGAVYVEPLTPRDIEKIKSVSRSKERGPWGKWWDEMAKKSAIRRLSKRLPLSADVHDLLQRDNDLYDVSRIPDPKPTVLDRLNAAQGQRALEHKEGFAVGHVTRETDFAKGRDIDVEYSQDNQIAGGAHTLSTGDSGAGSSPDAASNQGPAAADREGDDEPSKAQTPAEKSSPSNKISDEDRDFLVDVFRRMRLAVGEDVGVLRAQAKIYKDAIAEKPEIIVGKCKTIRAHLEDCCGEKPKQSIEQVARYIAGVIGVDEKTLMEDPDHG